MTNVVYSSLQSALAERYRIERELGSGGMATVYLAQDLRHDRKVAIKVLKPELAAVLGAERFVVEIKTTAALQHPHILPLFDSGTAEGQLYYVMPYIEGETIREKLNRETQFGIEDAVRIAREVADALDYAHRHGVIHRDIKPENILLHDGRAMVMDFGIALAVSAAAGGRMTETGLSLGTPHYMSPEQATADRDISARSDVYSLASVLYEMLAGQPPHVGGSAQQVIMKILTETAQPVRQLRKSVPANVDAALAKSLEKLPADRFDSARAFSDALLNPSFVGTGTAADSTRMSRVAGASWATASLIGGAVLAALGVAAAGWAWRTSRDSPTEAVVPLVLNLPPGSPDLGKFAVSPKGDRFAFSVADGIVVRDVGERDYRLLPGTANGEAPSFSPDGDWIAFSAKGHLRKIAVAGGSAIPLISEDTLLAGRLNWGLDGSIVFINNERMVLLPANGGAPRALSKASNAESPRLMPDGSGVLFVDTQRGSKLKYYDLVRDTVYTIIEESSEAQYLPPGYLLFAVLSGGVFALRFDPKHHATSGAPIPVIADMQPNGGVAPFTVTATGTLVYRSGKDPKSRLLRRQANGKIDTLPLPQSVLSYARFSPDGRKLAVTIGSARGSNRHTSVYDLALGSLTDFTDPGGHSPVWSPDGSKLAFTAQGDGSDAEDVYVQPIDRSTKPVRVFRLPNDQHASAWPSDTVLVFSSQSAPTVLGGSGASGGGLPASISVVNPTSPGSTRDYAKAQWDQYDASISPDGHWAAFTSTESGAPDVMVRRFPVADGAGMWKVSSVPGYRPRWSGDGRTIYYEDTNGKAIIGVHVTLAPKFELGTSEVVMTASNLGNAWDIDRRTGTIVVAQAVVSPDVGIVVMQHWLDQFVRSAAAKR